MIRLKATHFIEQYKLPQGNGVQSVYNIMDEIDKLERCVSFTDCQTGMITTAIFKIRYKQL